jgi:hypothetical protein
MRFCLLLLTLFAFALTVPLQEPTMIRSQNGAVKVTLEAAYHNITVGNTTVRK